MKSLGTITPYCAVYPYTVYAGICLYFSKNVIYGYVPVYPLQPSD